ncbi:MAG: alpha/beta fold hydrolase [Chloroflexi bacterium]|nr:alpha/beta fold hydrolase [Chloroflexota bacterium]
MKQFALLVLVLIATACATSTRAPTTLPPLTPVPPTLTELAPTQAAPGEVVRVIGKGGYLFTPPSGYNESARDWQLVFDGKPVARLNCMSNHCETQMTVPTDATAGAHEISVEGGSKLALQVVVKTARATPKPVPSPQSADAPNSYWVTNPMSNAHLFVQLIVPKNTGGKLPTLVLVPGGIGASNNFTDLPYRAQTFANAGFAVVVFDPDGRGKSSGVENYDGRAHQDGLAAILRFVATLDQVDAKKIGLVTYSYGITMGTGALARHPDVPVKFLIDWEGPANRNNTTGGCRANTPGGIQWQSCADEGFWREREAVNFIARVRVPYQRIQSEIDHVQPDNSHALAMVNAAAQAKLPFVRLNDDSPNQIYDPAAPPAMLPELQDRKLESRIIKYAQELFAR